MTLYVEGTEILLRNKYNLPSWMINKPQTPIGTIWKTYWETHPRLSTTFSIPPSPGWDIYDTNELSYPNLNRAPDGEDSELELYTLKYMLYKLVKKRLKKKQTKLEKIIKQKRKLLNKNEDLVWEEIIDSVKKEEKYEKKLKKDLFKKFCNT